MKNLIGGIQYAARPGDGAVVALHKRFVRVGQPTRQGHV